MGNMSETFINSRWIDPFHLSFRGDSRRATHSVCLEYHYLGVDILLCPNATSKDEDREEDKDDGKIPLNKFLPFILKLQMVILNLTEMYRWRPIHINTQTLE
jgi:hypothetical protein